MHLFLSPHLDDGVLSCGGTIHSLIARGEKVTVLTIMAGDPPDPLPDTPIVADLHQRWQAGYNPVAARRDEDRKACHLLGAEIIHMDVPDCVYRTAQVNGTRVALYPDEDSLWGDIHPHDPAPSLLRETVIPAATTLYVPVGSRNHVDHRIVRDWGVWLGATHESLNIFFYEEYPYESDATMELEHALSFYDPDALQLESLRLEEENVAAKLRAIACYRSQISTFWASLDDMEAATRQAMRGGADGAFAERFWRRI